MVYELIYLRNLKQLTAVLSSSALYGCTVHTMDHGSRKSLLPRAGSRADGGTSALRMVDDVVVLLGPRSFLMIVEVIHVDDFELQSDLFTLPIAAGVSR